MRLQPMSVRVCEHKKLTFKNDKMLTRQVRRDAVKWTTQQRHTSRTTRARPRPCCYHHRGVSCTDAAPAAPHLKRRKQRSKVSAVGFFGQEPTDADDLDDLTIYRRFGRSPKRLLSWTSSRSTWRCPTDEVQGRLGCAGVVARERLQIFQIQVMARQYEGSEYLGCPSTSTSL